MSLAHQLYLQSIREAEELDSVRFDAFRAPLMERLLDHVWRYAPWHRRRLAPLVVEGTLDMTRWEALPLLRPADIRDGGSALASSRLGEESEAVDRNDFAPVSRMSKMARIAVECERERFYELCEVDLAARMAVLDPDWKGAGSGPAWSITITDSPWFAGDPAASPDDQSEFLSRHNISILRTTCDIASRLTETGVDKQLDALIVVDDALDSGIRAQLRHSFDCRVVHMVARPVLGICALSTDVGQSYRVPAASMLVEVADGDGRSVGPGQRGELVLTPLHETAYPLLRLATGIGAVAPEKAGTAFGVRSLAEVSGPVSARPPRSDQP